MYPDCYKNYELITVMSGVVLLSLSVLFVFRQNTGWVLLYPRQAGFSLSSRKLPHFTEIAVMLHLLMGLVPALGGRGLHTAIFHQAGDCPPLRSPALLHITLPSTSLHQLPIQPEYRCSTPILHSYYP